MAKVPLFIGIAWHSGGFISWVYGVFQSLPMYVDARRFIIRRGSRSTRFELE